MERINPYPDHRLEITVRGRKLIIRKKKTWQADPEVVELYEDRVKQVVTRDTIPSHPFDFHVRFYWTDKVNYQIVNPGDDIFVSYAEQPNSRVLDKSSIRSKVQTWLLKIIRNMFSQHNRNSQIDLIRLLRCTNCLQDELVMRAEAMVCQGCGKAYLIQNGIPNMTNIAMMQS
jgi:uncharacterized protein YbaR (Trm112 family)